MTGNAGITRIPKEIIQSIAPNRVIFSATAPEITEDMELDTVWINTDNMYEYNIFLVPEVTAVKTGYGALYNWWVTQQELIEGFTVPTDAQWTELTDLLGGEDIAGGKLKSVRTDPDIAPRWNSPNTGATDEFGFSALPGGNRAGGGTYIAVGIIGFWWSSSENLATSAWNRLLNTNSITVDRSQPSKNIGYLIRCVRPLTTVEQVLNDGTFLKPAQDYDGNWYEVVKIGDLAWTAQNLRTTHYADGTPIPNVTNNTDWSNLTTGAYCWYNNDINTAGIVYTDENIVLQEGGHKFWTQLGIYSEQI